MFKHIVWGNYFSFYTFTHVLMFLLHHQFFLKTIGVKIIGTSIANTFKKLNFVTFGVNLVLCFPHADKWDDK